MRKIASTFVVAGLMLVPLGAQGRGGWYGSGAQGVPPGQMPPPGLCRVWYDNRPPGRQPSPTDCRQAERRAARDRHARVVYGAPAVSRYPNRTPYPYPDASRYPYPGDSPYPYPGDSRYPYPGDSRYPYPGTTRAPYGNRYPAYPYANVAWNQGQRDGYDKGREDARDRDSYDPVRHSRYRSADRGYERRYGSKDQYKLIYRDGFEAGYDQAYREWSGVRR